MEEYHGTDKNTLKSLLKGNIDVGLGGGELGRGFYTGEHLYVAKAWAKQRHNLNAAVLKIDVADYTVLNCNPISLDREETLEVKKSIKKGNMQRSFLFNRNIVWSPIVGNKKLLGNQSKWESLNSQNLLNSNSVNRSEV